MTVDLAQILRSADTSGWRDEALLRALLPHPRLTLHPVDGYSVRDVESELFVALQLPATATPAPDARVEAFRRELGELVEAFGEPHILGAYGYPGPFHTQPADCGSHFARWRGRPNSLELRAGPDGPELWLCPTDPLESWHWRQGHGTERALGGFFAYRTDPANAGLGLPGGWRTADWDVFEDALADFLDELPAATHALGFPLNFTLHSDGLLFDLVCEDRLEIACLLDHVPPGWRTGPPVYERWTEMPHTTDAYRPGEVPGREIAALLTATARADGARSPAELSLGDHAQRQNGYRVEYYGLTLREMP